MMSISARSSRRNGLGASESSGLLEAGGVGVTEGAGGSVPAV